MKEIILAHPYLCFMAYVVAIWAITQIICDAIEWWG